MAEENILPDDALDRLADALWVAHDWCRVSEIDLQLRAKLALEQRLLPTDRPPFGLDRLDTPESASYVGVQPETLRDKVKRRQLGIPEPITLAASSSGGEVNSIRGSSAEKAPGATQQGKISMTTDFGDPGKKPTNMAEYEAMRARCQEKQDARFYRLHFCLQRVAPAEVDGLVSEIHDHLMMCGSFGRFPEIRFMFQGVRHTKATSEIFWRSLHDFWTVCDGTNAVVLAKMMRRFKRGWRAEYMLPENLDAYNELPELIKVWRGQDRGDFGLSWSTSREVALRFALRQRRICKNPTLLSGLAPKQLVAGAFEDRNEHEVLLFENELRNVEIDDGPDLAAEAKEAAVARCARLGAARAKDQLLEAAK